MNFFAVIGWVHYFLSFLVTFEYFVCWRKQGQTLGMKAWRLRLQQADGNLASPYQCIKRSAMAPLSLAAVGIGYLWILWPSNVGCIHDILTDTEVVVVPKEQ